MAFEWDERKNALNIQKHEIDFDTAKLIFDGPVVEAPDRRFDYGEERMQAIGSVEGRELVVIYTDRGEARRIISARRAHSHERRAYRQAFPDLDHSE
jgi:uncharacterized DUF497 family protein